MSEDVIDVTDTVHECLTMVKVRAAKKSLMLTASQSDNLPLLQVDKVKFKQILLNLLSNAIKFTPENGSITVYTELKHNDSIVLKVVDTGIGIAPEDIPIVTNPFEQIGDATLSHKEGTGLGLALSKRLVELHGGTLEIGSEISKGTTVTVKFPLERSIRDDIAI